jgi:hypothetical protein
MTTTDWPKEALTAETMQTLDRILRDWCAENGQALSGVEARLTAKSLVDWFEFGVHDERELQTLVRDRILLESLSLPNTK